MDLRRRSAHTGGMARAAHGPVPRRKHSRRNEAADGGDQVAASHRMVQRQHTRFRRRASRALYFEAAHHADYLLSILTLGMRRKGSF